MFDDAAAMGSWDAYFEAVYQRVDKKMLDEDKKRYQGASSRSVRVVTRLTSLVGSEEETEDLYEAYKTHGGSLPAIMSHILHSTPSDESRFIKAINDAIASGTLESLPAWKKTSTDKKAREARARKAKKEEKEAEDAAREMGLWDEFYGDGKTSSTKTSSTKGKRGTKRKEGEEEEEEEDVSGLAAIIAKRQTSRASAFDALLAKYGHEAGEDEDVVEFSGKPGGKSGKGKRRGEDASTEEVGDMPVSW